MFKPQAKQDATTPRSKAQISAALVSTEPFAELKSAFLPKVNGRTKNSGQIKVMAKP